ncbi:MAG: YkgJ family cysteine cluster protein, partial [Planctomycetota bacterium]
MPTSLAEYYRGVEAASRAVAAAGARSPAVTAAAVHAALTPLLAGEPGGSARACREGCGHCCHFPVGVTFGEAMLLAAAVREPALAAAVLGAAATTADRAWPELVGTPCPLLRAGRCAAYAIRPLPCRALASADATACERA